MIILKIILFVSLTTIVVNADCDSFGDCQSCAGANRGSCSFCVTTSKCLSLIGLNCRPENIIKDPFDCPADVPSKQYAYDDQFARYTIYPLIAATYNPNPQSCFQYVFTQFP